MNKQEIIKRQYEKSKQTYGNLLITDGQSTQNSITFQDGISLTQGGKNILTSTASGTEFKKDIKKGSVQREVNNGFQREFITKEMFIPSSIVTPIPDKMPWFGFFTQIKQLSDIIDQLGG